MFICGIKISTWSVLLLSCFYLTRSEDVQKSTEDKKDPLVAVESKNDKTIIKQISKLNEDGTYTFGYEADDGTFKYESRDVLGNVKSTLGFIDNNGVIKRVSYTSNDHNNTSETSGSLETSEEVTESSNQNETIIVTTRRPSSLVYPQVSTTKSNVIQSIPKRKSSTSSPVTASSTDSPRTTYSTQQSPKLVFATSIPSTTPRIVMPPSPHTRPVLQNGIFVRSTIPPQNHGRIEGQLIRPVQVDSTTTKPVTEGNVVRRVLVSRQSGHDPSKTSTETQITSSTSRPLLESELDKEQTTKSHRSNTFRRQLSQEKSSDYDPQQQVLNLQQSAGDDTTDIYGSSVATGTQRPLFTTTQSSRVLPTPTQRQNLLRNNHYLGYRRQSSRNRQDPLVEAPTTQPSTTEEVYQTQTTIPVISIPEYPDQERSQHYGRPRPTSNNIFRNREYLREAGPQVEIADAQTTYASSQDPNQYLRENVSPNGPMQFPQATPPPVYRTRRLRPIPQNIAYNGEYPEQNGYQQPIPVPPPNYLRANYGPVHDTLTNAISEDIHAPVTNRDFQRLLQQLIFVQSKLQQLAQIVQYQNPHQNIYHGYPPPIQQYPQQIPIPIPQSHNPHHYGPIQFEQNQPNLVRNRGYLPTYPDEPQQYEQYDQRYNNHIRRRAHQQPTLYDQDQQQEQQQQQYLPPEIREMLLLRMLQLAIHSEIAATNQMEVIATSPTKTAPSRKEHNPIRNVKILGEEKERLKPTARNKRYQDPNEDLDYYE